MTIDRRALPEVALVDTNVFIRFLREKQDDKTAVCADFCDAMIAERKTILIAAPTLAEVVRHRGRAVPRTSGIEVVPFDRKAADILGEHLPHAKLVEIRDETKLPLHYWKYDSLILACAIRWAAHCVVSTDDPLKRLGARVPFKVQHPREFEAAPSLFALYEQLSLSDATAKGAVASSEETTAEAEKEETDIPAEAAALPEVESAPHASAAAGEDGAPLSVVPALPEQAQVSEPPAVGQSVEVTWADDPPPAPAPRAPAPSSPPSESSDPSQPTKTKS